MASLPLAPSYIVCIPSTRQGLADKIRCILRTCPKAKPMLWPTTTLFAGQTCHARTPTLRREPHHMGFGHLLLALAPRVVAAPFLRVPHPANRGNACHSIASPFSGGSVFFLFFFWSLFFPSN
ncbi:hypothetical protein F4810DRAFT_320059 [Camillea tinctor]|nr:hypothetical protein F4810DRAFT_320059 [Camillea tinctor]